MAEPAWLQLAKELSAERMAHLGSVLAWAGEATSLRNWKDDLLDLAGHNREYRRNVEGRYDAARHELEAVQAQAAALQRAGRMMLDSLEEYVRQSMHHNPEWRSGIVALEEALSANAGSKLLQAAREAMETLDRICHWYVAHTDHCHVEGENALAHLREAMGC